MCEKKVDFSMAAFDLGEGVVISSDLEGLQEELNKEFSEDKNISEFTF